MYLIWILLMAQTLIVLCVAGYIRGPRFAVGLTVVLSAAHPRWVEINILGHDVSTVVASGIASLGYYCLHPKRVFRTRLQIVDYCMIALVATNVCSDMYQQENFWAVIARAYGEWFVPFVLGRLAFDRWQDVPLMSIAIACVLCVVSLFALVESCRGLNLFEYFLIERPSESLPKYMFRFGWQRSFGPTTNPIYFGTLMVILLPWSLWFGIQSLDRKGVNLLRPLSPMTSIAGVAASISRAPILSIAILFTAYSFVSFQRFRIYLAILVLTTTAAGILFREDFMSKIRELGGEQVSSRETKILVDGEKVRYTSTEHRFLLWDLYKTALSHAGLLGYGTERTSTFPPNVPMGGQNDVDAVKRLWSIDNFYLLIILRFGFLGLLSWCTVMFSAMYCCYRLTQTWNSTTNSFFALQLGGLVATSFILYTVWMPHDFGFFLVWTFGIVAGATASKDFLTYQ